ncbi:MAG TPA: formyltetrahydrofolate deformylase [Acidimicrobiales bacterium]|nr:formyltetrahydrofolate deformylase [Acidimicrobiales bacterium]
MVSPHGVLLVSCPDGPGIVAAIAGFVHDHGGNIVDLQQHTDAGSALFFQRVEFELDGFDLSGDGIRTAASSLVERFSMRCEVRFTDWSPPTAVLVSKEPHCCNDLLSRWRAGELSFDLRTVISNHPDHAEMASWFGVAYHHLPTNAETRRSQEERLEAILEAEGVELVVLARYMQILSPELVGRWCERIINIHHSFLPAFQGARPYHQAHDRGVKLVGVTAHYVSAGLDDGPIIDQDVVRVSHRDDIDDLRRKGRELEMAVLARAVRAHLEHRVLVHGNRTIVFEG